MLLAGALAPKAITLIQEDVDVENDIQAGDCVRLLDLPDWMIHDLPEEEQIDMCSFIGQCTEVKRIDDYGYYWLSFGSLPKADGTLYNCTGHSFCVPIEFIQFVSHAET